MLDVLRKIAILSTASTAWVMFIPYLAHADELDNLQRSREASEMKYVNELGTGKYKTAGEREALKKKYLEPSEQKTKEYFQSISAMPTARPVKPEEIDLHSGPKTNLSTVQVPSSESGQVTSHMERTNTVVPAQEKSPLRPEYVLDGSNVPKEITFGTPSFDNPKAPTPSPTPSVGKK